MDVFCENKCGSYFHKRAPSLMFDRVGNTLLAAVLLIKTYISQTNLYYAPGRYYATMILLRFYFKELSKKSKTIYHPYIDPYPGAYCNKITKTLS